ncbi:hypothetical protein V6N13_103422 [Hibiscus sabdariffa]
MRCPGSYGHNHENKSSCQRDSCVRYIIIYTNGRQFKDIASTDLTVRPSVVVSWETDDLRSQALRSG